MTTPQWAEAGIDACDRCLALSHLTVSLASVPEIEPMAATGATHPRDLVAHLDGISAGRATSLSAGLDPAWTAGAVRGRCLEHGVAAFCRCSSRFPPCLAELDDPPWVLFSRGDAGLLRHCSADAVAMVGTRRPTLVGREAARRIAAGAARVGAIVVSGMALGIDAASHEGALSVGAPTIAVLAGGAERASPSSHRRLYAHILERGLVVSEMAPGVRPFHWAFPARNRLIAALTRSTLVVEAPIRSGALITVEHAGDLGRDVFAVPGSLASATCEGSNRLLVDLAKAVTEGADLVRLGDRKSGTAPVTPVDGPGAEVHAALARGPLTIDEVARRATTLGPGEVELALLDLELAGWIARRPDGRYRVVDRWAS